MKDCVNGIPFAVRKIFASVAQKEITSQTEKCLVILSSNIRFGRQNDKVLVMLTNYFFQCGS